MPVPGKSAAAYALLLAVAFAAAVAGSRIFGGPLERAVYDEMFRLYRPAPWQPESALLVIDERSMSAIPGGIGGIRGPLARGLTLACAAGPRAVAIDLILADRRDPNADREFASALHGCPNVVLASQLYRDGGGW